MRIRVRMKRSFSVAVADCRGWIRWNWYTGRRWLLQIDRDAVRHQGRIGLNVAADMGDCAHLRRARDRRLWVKRDRDAVDYPPLQRNLLDWAIERERRG